MESQLLSMMRVFQLVGDVAITGVHGIVGVVGLVGVVTIVAIVGSVAIAGAVGAARLMDVVWARLLPELQAIVPRLWDCINKQVTGSPESGGGELKNDPPHETGTTQEKRVKQPQDKLEEERGANQRDAEKIKPQESRVPRLNSHTRQTHEQNTEENKRLQDELEEERGVNQRNMEEIKRLKSEVARLNSNTQQTHERHTTQAKEIKRLRDELEEERAANQRNKKEIKQLESEVAHLNRLQEEGTMSSHTKQTHEQHTTQSKVEELEAELSGTEGVANEWNIEPPESEIALLKEPTATPSSLEDAAPLLHAPISKADNISVTEVADLVKILNAQIEQAASLVTDSVVDQKSPSSVTELGLAWDELEVYLGSWLRNNLRRRSKHLISEPDPLITQIALQTGLANACSCIINNWNHLLSEAQATAEAWGTLSRSYKTVSQNEPKRYLTDVLVKLLTAIGGPLESGGTLPPQYNEKVEDMARKAVALHKIVTEDVISMELATYTIPSGTLFDSSQMDDTEGKKHENGFTPHDAIICTVEMGLWCRKRVEPGKQNGSSKKWAVSMKSKVVLAAALEHEGR